MDILGPDGQPLRKQVLTQEIAGPTQTGVRQILSGHPAQGLTPARLAQLLRAAEHGDAVAYLEMAEEMEERDLRYLTVLGTRKRQVCQLEIDVEPAGESARHQADAQLLREVLAREALQDELFDILDAVGKGYSVTEIVWETSARQWMPARLEWRDPRWFVLDRVDGRTLRLADQTAPDGVDLPPFKFIQHKTQAKSGLPVRGGLARAVSWWYLFKNYAVKDWIAFVEIYGQPLRVGKWHQGATQEDKRVLLRALSSIGTDAAAMIPENMMIEFVESSGASARAEIYENLCHYIDTLVTQVVLGQNLTTDVQEGSRAAAQVHDAVRADIEAADARQLAATLGRDLVRPVVDLNNGPPPDGTYPRLRVGRPEQVDLTQFTQTVETLARLGLPVSKADVYAKTGLKEPKDAGDALTPAAPGGAPARDRPDAEPDGEPESATAASRPPGTRRFNDVADDLADQLDRVAGDAQTAMIAEIETLVAEASSLDEVADGLLGKYPDIDGTALADLMRQALVAAELAGRNDILG